jgi:hypothetical protein
VAGSAAVLVHSQAPAARAIGFRGDKCRWSSFSPPITISAMVSDSAINAQRSETWCVSRKFDERTDRNVISVRIAERELLGLSIRIHV